jgi:hypothetical protein
MNTRRFLIATVCALAVAFALQFAEKNIRFPQRIPAATAANAPKLPNSVRALRPNYPYSVIAGGAYSPAELRYASTHDALVREHYAGFDMNSARLTVSTEDRYQYASFRLKNAIFWTQSKLRIPKGEMLLTDGRNYARTRCGNRLSGTAMAKTVRNEPSESLSLPPVQPEMLVKGEIQLAEAPPLVELDQTSPPLLFGPPTAAPLVAPRDDAAAGPVQFWGPVATIYIPGAPLAPRYIPASTPLPPGTSQPPPPTVTTLPPIISEVPEPAGLYLFGATFCVSLWFLTRMMRGDVAVADATEDES